MDRALDASIGSKIRFMEPGALNVEMAQEDGTDERQPSKRATWWCLPYFCLAKYAGDLSAHKPGSHPMQTLLQARFHSVKKDRDMQQAICKISGPASKSCFHIAQLWCIVIDKCTFSPPLTHGLLIWSSIAYFLRRYAIV